MERMSHMRIGILSAVTVLGFSITSSAVAQCTGHSNAATAKAASDVEQAAATSAKTCSADRSDAKSSCNKGMAGCRAMPVMQYKVGDETVSCPKAAEKLAQEKGAQIIYLVSGKEYSSKSEALKTYADVVEEHLKLVTTVRYMAGDKCVACPREARELAKKSGGAVKYCVAGVVFEDQTKAEQAAKEAAKAAEAVQLTTFVDGKPYTCDKVAAEACQKSGHKAEYAVGECKTNCKITARVELAKARIEAARQAVAKASAVASAAQP
jgi:hypothetical protein